MDSLESKVAPNLSPECATGTLITANGIARPVTPAVQSFDIRLHRIRLLPIHHQHNIRITAPDQSAREQNVQLI